MTNSPAAMREMREKREILGINELAEHKAARKAREKVDTDCQHTLFAQIPRRTCAKCSCVVSIA